jgi:hypothetical protein
VNRQVLRRALPLALLLLLFGLLVFSVAWKSPTADEQNHLARGLAYLKTGDLRLSQEHPPGVNVWEAWPLLLDPRIRLPLDTPSWEHAEWYGFADQLLWGVNDRPQAMIFAVRVPVMWLTLLLAAVAYRWARELGGTWAGLATLVLLVLDPNLLAHGRLATTDMGVTCLSLVAIWALWHAVQQPTWARWFTAGAILGLAQLSKFSALIWIPLGLFLVAVAWVGQCVRRGRLALREGGRWAARLLLLWGVSLAVTWGGYAFSWGPISLLGGLPGPAPAYWAGIETILGRTGGGTPAFLIGQVGDRGWWYYFPVALAIKTPLPTLIVLVGALGIWVHGWVVGRGKAERSAHDGALWPGSALYLALPALAVWTMAIAGSFNIGYRHILPALPFLYVWAGWQVALWGARVYSGPRAARLRWAAVGGGLCLWLAVGTLAVAPHYLAFFNAIAGGPDGGYRYLVDSNLDWGQDLPGLARYVRDQGIERVYLSWFGAAHPEAYDLPFHPLPGFWRFRGEPSAYGFNPYRPAPGVYAISATNLQGVALADRDTYAWFRGRTPVARIGHSIFIYRVEDVMVEREVVVLGVPMAQLADEEKALLQRASSVRQYDPETGVIAPLFPAAAGQAWFVTPQSPGGQVVRQGPGYLVVESAFVELRPSETGPRFGEQVIALHHSVAPAALSVDRTLTVVVLWSVDQPPHRAARSFAHLLSGEGQYLAGWDGLTAPATCWQEGDLIRQQYAIPLPGDLLPGVYALEIGWYDVETLQRWPAFLQDAPIGDRWLLTGIEIQP